MVGLIAPQNVSHARLVGLGIERPARPLATVAAHDLRLEGMHEQPSNDVRQGPYESSPGDTPVTPSIKAS